MRTKKIYSKPRRYKNVRVADPTEYHSVVLYPRQGLTLILSSGELKVKLNSEMLIDEGKKIDSKGREVYTFSQKYDLDISDLPKGKDSSVALGSICIIRKNSQGGITESNVVVSLLRNKTDTISCFNPSEEYVQIFPHSMLRVLIPASSLGYSDNCKIDIHGDNGICVVAKSKGAIQIPNIWNPAINPYIDEDSKVLVGSESAVDFVNFYEFILDKDSVKKTVSMHSDKINIGKIFLQNDKKIRVVNLVLNNVAKERKPFKETPAFVSQSDPLLREESQVGNMNILINPAENEYFEFSKNGNAVSIQMAPVHLIYPERGEDAKWVCNVEKPSQKISVTEGSEVFRWGHSFQAFIVDLDRQALMDSSSSGHVGSILIGLEADGKNPPHRRRISFWMSPKEIDRFNHNQNYGNNDLCGVNYVSRRSGKRPDETLKLKVSTDLKFSLISINELFKGIQTHSFNTSPPPPPPPYVAPKTPIYSVPKEKKNVGGSVYLDPKDGTEINLPASSKITIRMPFEEKSSGMAGWAVRIKEDRLIKVSDIRTSVNGESFGYLELDVESNLSGDLGATALGGSILFTNGTDNRLIKIRIIAANAVVHTNVPFKPGRMAQKNKKNVASLVKCFQHRDSVVLSPKETLYLKTPKFSEGFDVSVDLVQKPFPHDISINYDLRSKLNDSAVWYPTGHLTITNNSVIIRKIEGVNPAWEDILKALKGRKDPVHIADLIFTGRSVNDVSVHTAFGEIQQNTKVSKVLHLMLNVSEPEESCKQIAVYNPADRTEIAVENNDEVLITLKKNISTETVGEWPWFLSKQDNQGVSFLKLDKKSGDFVWHFKVRNKPENSDRTTITFSVCDGREKKDVSIQLVFKLK